MRRELLKNKLYGILLIVAGLISVPLLSGDGTFATLKAVMRMRKLMAEGPSSRRTVNVDKRR